MDTLSACSSKTPRKTRNSAIQLLYAMKAVPEQREAFLTLMGAYVTHYSDAAPVAKEELDVILEQLVGGTSQAVYQSTTPKRTPLRHHIRSEESWSPSVTLLSQGVFGAPITQEGICVLQQLVEYLSAPAVVVTSGLFRVSGSTERMQSVRTQLSGGTTVDLHSPSLSCTPHDAANLLKQFLSELPDPAFPSALKLLWTNICEDIELARSAFVECRGPRKEKRLSLVRVLMCVLGAEHKEVIVMVLTLLHKISLHHASNLMDRHNLAVIFAPALFFAKCRAYSDQEQVRLLPYVIELVECLIEHVSELLLPPKELLRDVWDHAERTGFVHRLNGTTASVMSDTALHSVAVSRRQPLVTDSATNTQTELARLHAHVQSLPDTDKNKHRLLKKMQEECRRQNGLLVGSSLKMASTSTTPSPSRRHVSLLHKLSSKFSRTKPHKPDSTCVDKDNAENESSGEWLEGVQCTSPCATGVRVRPSLKVNDHTALL